MGTFSGQPCWQVAAEGELFKYITGFFPFVHPHVHFCLCYFVVHGV